MAKARKLPSGRWNIQIYEKETGKRVSITEDTKHEAEYAALEYAEKQKRKKRIQNCPCSLKKVHKYLLLGNQYHFLFWGHPGADAEQGAVTGLLSLRHEGQLTKN